GHDTHTRGGRRRWPGEMDDRKGIRLAPEGSALRKQRARSESVHSLEYALADQPSGAYRNSFVGVVEVVELLPSRQQSHRSKLNLPQGCGGKLVCSHEAGKRAALQGEAAGIGFAREIRLIGESDTAILRFCRYQDSRLRPPAYRSLGAERRTRAYRAAADLSALRIVPRP